MIDFKDALRLLLKKKGFARIEVDAVRRSVMACPTQWYDKAVFVAVFAVAGTAENVMYLYVMRASA